MAGLVACHGKPRAALRRTNLQRSLPYALSSQLRDRR